MRDQFTKPHMEIANAIRLAKKRMFKRHRGGIQLHAARDAFIAEVEEVITEQDFQLRGHPPKDERARQSIAINSEAASETDEVPAAQSDHEAFLERARKCEAWAKKACAGCEEAKELAVVSLLNEIARADGADAQNLATGALYAAFRASSGLIDDAISLTLAAKAKGGDA